MLDWKNCLIIKPHYRPQYYTFYFRCERSAISLSFENNANQQTCVMNPVIDPWVITPRERAKYLEQFRALNPLNEIVTGAQAREFFLQSQLPPLTLGEIW